MAFVCDVLAERNESPVDTTCKNIIYFIRPYLPPYGTKLF